MLEDDAFRQSMSQAVDSMWLIEGISGLTLADVKQQEQLYLALRDTLTRRYAALADLATARRFGLQVDPELAPRLAEYAVGNSVARFPQFDALLTQVATLARQHRFFHWELEFPEVFFDNHGYALGEKAGFAVVVGNPPYVRQETLAPYKQYFAHIYPEVYDSGADLYVFFFAGGIRILQHGGRLSYIASNSWLRASYATSLRKFLREKVSVENIVDLGDNRVFADAPDVYPAIVVTRQSKPPEDASGWAAVFRRGEGIAAGDLAAQIHKRSNRVAFHDQSDFGWQLGEPAERQLLRRLSTNGVVLNELIDGRMYYGIKTGLNAAFVITDAQRKELIEHAPQSAGRLRPWVSGENLRPWYQQQSGEWIVFFPSGWTDEELGSRGDEAQAWSRLEENFYPLAKHLQRYESAARKRQDQGQYWWELRACDYYDAFQVPKVLWPDIAKFPRFSRDESGLLLGNTGYVMTASEAWLLPALSSRCTWFQISRTSIAFGERAGAERYRLVDQYMRPLRMPVPTTESKRALGDISDELTKDARARYALHRQARHRILS
jgi:hypothetical protein